MDLINLDPRQQLAIIRRFPFCPYLLLDIAVFPLFRFPDSLNRSFETVGFGKSPQIPGSFQKQWQLYVGVWADCIVSGHSRQNLELIKNINNILNGHLVSLPIRVHVAIQYPTLRFFFNSPLETLKMISMDLKMLWTLYEWRGDVFSQVLSSQLSFTCVN